MLINDMESNWGVIFGNLIFLCNVIVEMLENPVKELTLNYRGKNLV